MPDKLSFVIPCFNNEENIDDLFLALLENEKQFTSVDFEYVLVDDASTDKTFELLTKWQQKFPAKIKTIHLEKNIGSHKAVFKGLTSVTGDCFIVMAADLQDPPELSVQLFNEWKKGSKCIIAVKKNQGQSGFSRFFHFIMRTLFVSKAPEGAFDCVLVDSIILPKLLQPSLKNCNLFYRIVELVPNYSIVYYLKRPRQRGKSGWTLSKKLCFFIENIIYFSISKIGILK